MLKLDYTIQSPQERTALVSRIIEETPPEQLTNKYLEILSNYIIFAMDKKERLEGNILTDNRMVTVNKNETSFEGLCGKLENGEDGIYSMLSDLGKQTILNPKDSISQQDEQNLPYLQELADEIAKVEEEFKAATGKRKFKLKQQIIQMRQDRYILRNDARGQ